MEIAKSRDQSCVEESKKVVGKGRCVQVHLEFENKIFYCLQSSICIWYSQIFKNYVLESNGLAQ